MDNTTINEMLNLLNIQRKHCIVMGSKKAKTVSLFLACDETGEKLQNIYYSGFAAMAEKMFIVNGYYLKYNPVKEEHYFIEMEG